MLKLLTGYKIHLVYLGLLAASGAALYAVIWYNGISIDKLEKQKTSLIEERALLTESNKAYESTLNTLQANIVVANNRNAHLNRQYHESTKKVSKLEDKLAKHDLQLLAKTKPVLVTDIINTGIERVRNSFETTTSDFYTKTGKNTP